MYSLMAAQPTPLVNNLSEVKEHLLTYCLDKKLRRDMPINALCLNQLDSVGLPGKEIWVDFEGCRIISDVGYCFWVR